MMKMRKLLSVLLVLSMITTGLPMSANAQIVTNSNGSIYFTTFEDLKELAAGNYTYAEYAGTEALVISENLTLPEKLVLYTYGAEMVIPAGVTFSVGEFIGVSSLTVEGTMHAYDVFVSEKLTITGTLYANDNISMNFVTEVIGQDKIVYADDSVKLLRNTDVFDLATLQEMIALANASTDPHEHLDISVYAALNLSESVTFPGNCSVSFLDDVTVAAGATLTLSESGDYSYNVLAATMTVSGTLVNERKLSIDNISPMDVGGLGLLTIAEGGSYSGNGRLVVYGYEMTDVQAALAGINLSDFEIEFFTGDYSPYLEDYKSYWVLTAKKKESEDEDTTGNILTIQDGTFQYLSSVTKEIESYTFDYDENWFFEDGTGYNHEMARTSMAMALAASRETCVSIQDMFDTMGFTSFEDHYVSPGQDTIGFAIGSKTITNASHESVTLIAVAIRGGDYGNEWASNITIGASSEHQGFKEAADKVISAVKAHLGNIETADTIKIWLTGFSRAAATANLAAHYLAADGYYGRISGLDADGVMAYCFACPSGVRTDHPSYSSDYGQIYNIVSPVDLVPMVAPSEWDFTRYGITYYLPSAELNYNGFQSGFSDMKAEYTRILLAADFLANMYELTEYKTNQRKKFINIVEALSSYIQSQNMYVIGYQNDMRTVVSKGSDGKAGAIAELVLSILPTFPVLHPIATSNLVSSFTAISNNHYHELYLSWMNSLSGKEGYTNYNRTRYLKVNCPVDISVYDSTGTLVARIVNDEVQEIENSTICAELDENGQKVICLPLDEEFRIEITATDNGTMSYQIEEVDIETGNTGRLINYYDVEIETGDVLTGIAGSVADDDTEVAAYSLTTAEGETLPVDSEMTGENIVKHTLTVNTEGFGKTVGGGLYLSGEYAKVTAEPGTNSEFYGWYVGDMKVSEEMEYRFRVEEDVAMVGKFSPVTRIFGSNRYNTALAAADQLKENLGVEKFENIVVACGTDFADALSGSYLANQKNAPILLVNKYSAVMDPVKEYIRENLTPGGTVYLLGGTGVMPAEMETGLEGFEIKRLQGANRYMTNLEILKEAGVEGKPILVCTGLDFADGLSASAVNQPILLVTKVMLEEQTEYLETLGSTEFYIIGGTGAVNEKVETVLREHGSVQRIEGANRYVTSVNIAKTFFPEAKSVVLAYAFNFPDGLSGGCLAHSMGAPLILTNSNVMKDVAAAYVQEMGITGGAVLGGTSLISDAAVNDIFQIS